MSLLRMDEHITLSWMINTWLPNSHRHAFNIDERINTTRDEHMNSSLKSFQQDMDQLGLSFFLQPGNWVI